MTSTLIGFNRSGCNLKIARVVLAAPFLAFLSIALIAVMELTNFALV